MMTPTGILSPAVLPAFQAAAEAAPSAATSHTIGWWATGAIVVALPILCFVLAKMTRLGMIGAATFKEAIRQPLFLMLLALTILILIVNTFLPFYSLGEDVKMLKDCGLATLLVCGLFLAVWTASISIAEEIEGKTAMTLLSKPITRRQFVLGKYVGIMESVLLLLAVSGAVLLFCVYFKVGYDARESGKEVPSWFVLESVGGMARKIPLPEPERFAETVQVMPGLVLIFLEISVLGAISVAIATRLPMVVNLTTCFAIFVIGHLTPIIVLAESSVRGFGVVQFVGRLIATVLPALEWFSMQGAVATQRLVPPDYLGYAALYALAFSAAAILLAFILFEDRDLA
jgi:ABC-type transport system involved in multi-copper enzyme maturation permease subunit